VARVTRGVSPLIAIATGAAGICTWDLARVQGAGLIRVSHRTGGVPSAIHHA